ncbi:glycosyltransferase family 25 protein [Comamonas composti]|uniref:glycosyltransferase family 25 protein n=1 Tax=Comamonas composti TaxID=408558 RepID=UPI000409CA8B|nr:glycosyltransferase family 25 protein [Comamonas composti]
MPSIPIVYINLAKDAERKQRMQAQFSNLGLAASRLPAVWWNDLDEEAKAYYFSSQLNSRQYFKPMGNGEKGCYCSHITAWRQLLDGDAPALAVFEDDVRLLPTLPQALQSIAALPADRWDMIKLFGRPKEKIASRKYLSDSSLELISYSRIPSFATGYVVSRAGAHKLLASRLPFGRPIDVDLRFWFENDLQVFGIQPSVIALDDTSEVSSIWMEKEPPPALPQRLRKLRMKLELGWGNALHRAKTPKASHIL